MASSPASLPRLYGVGVSAEALARLAEVCGCQPMPDGSTPSDEREGCDVLVVATDRVPDLPTMIGQNFNAVMEYIDGEQEIDAESVDNLTSGELCFSFSTSSAYTMDSAAIICDTLLSRGALSPMRRSDIELALHEALSNAVVHGNLAVQSNTKGDFGHFAKFALELQAMMASPEARRRVDIVCKWDHEFLDITVTDKGRGYDASMLPKDVDPFVPAGRGLAIIRSLALSMNVTHGGRVSTLRFLI